MNTVRLGAGLGFYGDDWTPVRATLERGDVHFLVSDHLSELTLAILAKDRARDVTRGYTRDLVPMLEDLLPLALSRGVRWVVNAGGLAPVEAREAVLGLLAKLGLRARVAAIVGDSLLPRLDELAAEGHLPLPLGQAPALGTLGARLLFANAYLGARPVAEALDRGADIVITGRVADAALSLGPLLHAFKWRADDWDRLAQGVVVGHLLECNAQASGGNFSGDWQAVPDLAHIGYPIAEVSADGAALLTKPLGTGGRVSFETVREQLLYEVHDPSAYVTPDVVVDLTGVQLQDLGGDRVRVTGARGRPAPHSLKVVGGYRDGYMAQAQLWYSWPDAIAKARAAAGMLRARADAAGLAYTEWHESLLGVNALHGPLAPEPAEANEVAFRVACRFENRATAEAFTRLVPALALSGPPTAAGYAGRAEPRELLSAWSGLVPREAVAVKIVV